MLRTSRLKSILWVVCLAAITFSTRGGEVKLNAFGGCADFGLQACNYPSDCGQGYNCQPVDPQRPPDPDINPDCCIWNNGACTNDNDCGYSQFCNYDDHCAELDCSNVIADCDEAEFYCEYERGTSAWCLGDNGYPPHECPEEYFVCND